jgi:hypothetical protein
MKGSGAVYTLECPHCGYVDSLWNVKKSEIPDEHECSKCNQVFLVPKIKKKAKEQKPRKPVAMVIALNGEVLLVCDDGSVFVLPTEGKAESLGLEVGNWNEGFPVPGSARDLELKRADDDETKGK